MIKAFPKTLNPTWVGVVSHVLLLFLNFHSICKVSNTPVDMDHERNDTFVENNISLGTFDNFDDFWWYSEFFLPLHNFSIDFQILPGLILSHWVKNMYGEKKVDTSDIKGQPKKQEMNLKQPYPNLTWTLWAELIAPLHIPLVRGHLHWPL